MQERDAQRLAFWSLSLKRSFEDRGADRLWLVLLVVVSSWQSSYTIFGQLVVPLAICFYGLYRSPTRSAVFGGLLANGAVAVTSLAYIVLVGSPPDMLSDLVWSNSLTAAVSLLGALYYRHAIKGGST